MQQGLISFLLQLLLFLLTLGPVLNRLLDGIDHQKSIHTQILGPVLGSYRDRWRDNTLKDCSAVLSGLFFHCLGRKVYMRVANPRINRLPPISKSPKNSFFLAILMIFCFLGPELYSDTNLRTVTDGWLTIGKRKIIGPVWLLQFTELRKETPRIRQTTLQYVRSREKACHAFSVH